MDFLFSFLFERLSQQQLVMPRNSITIVGTLKFTNPRNKNGSCSNKRNKRIKMEIKYALIVIQKIVFCNTLILVLCELPSCDTKAASS